jgi:hypothetical protein
VPNHQVHFNRAEHSEEERQGSCFRWAPLGVAMTTVCLNHFGAACTSSFSIGKLGGPLELGNAIFEYLEVFHNQRRRHSMLGMCIPVEYEKTRRPSCHAWNFKYRTPRNPGHIKITDKPRAVQKLQSLEKAT